jgi:hypothetical protein
MILATNNKYFELNPSPTNCQCPKMDSHFEYVITKHGTAYTGMKAGPSLDNLLA